VICSAPGWDQIINMGHELAQLAGKIDWDFIDGAIAVIWNSSKNSLSCT
jgi:hypothetical protein